MTPEILRFLIAGGLAATVNWSSRFLFSLFLPYEGAVALAYTCGMATGFFAMRRWVFHASTGPIRRQAVTYVVVNMLGLAQTLVCSSVFARYLLPAVGIERFAEPIAHAIGIVVPVFTSFIGHKRATFAQRPAQSEGQPAAPTPAQHDAESSGPQRTADALID